MTATPLTVRAVIVEPPLTVAPAAPQVAVAVESTTVALILIPPTVTARFVTWAAEVATSFEPLVVDGSTVATT